MILFIRSKNQCQRINPKRLKFSILKLSMIPMKLIEKEMYIYLNDNDINNYLDKYLRKGENYF